jgi:hypothetical protein
MLARAFLIAAFAVTPCHAGKSAERDGSTMEKAIPLKQRGMKAVEEQMQWMMKASIAGGSNHRLQQAERLR